jgi:hypothetical protein
VVRDEISFEQNNLRADVEVVRRYGEEHPEVWVELRFENEPTVRIVALFAGGDLEAHEGALRRLVSHPDQLEVRASPWPAVHLEQIRAAVQEMATSSEPGLFSGWGTGGGKVMVRLRADGERVAAQLRERFGEAVDLTVGFLHYPDCGIRGSGGPLGAHSAQPRTMELPEVIHVAVDEDLRVRSGANLQATIRLTNDGDEEVVVHTNGRLTAMVLDPKTNETVGGYAGAQTMPLVLFRAPRGGSVDIPLLLGTASMTPRLGYSVPAGRWAIEITLDLGTKGAFRTPRFPLAVVP